MSFIVIFMFISPLFFGFRRVIRLFCAPTLSLASRRLFFAVFPIGADQRVRTGVVVPDAIFFSDSAFVPLYRIVVSRVQSRNA